MELATTEATLKVLQEMEHEKQELKTLEAENRQRLALQEAENAAKQKALEEKRRQIVLRDSQEDECCKSTSSTSCGTSTKFHKCITCYSDTKATRGQHLPSRVHQCKLSPSTFYFQWKMSFQTLIDRKNIPVYENVYYLCKYVSGPAKKAIESYFLLGTDAAYHGTSWRKGMEAPSWLPKPSGINSLHGQR